MYWDNKSISRRTDTPSLELMASWAAITLETVLAHFERDYGDILARNEKRLTLERRSPKNWAFARPPQSKDYMGRLINIQLDRLGKSRSRLPPLQTNHDTTGPGMAADLQGQYHTIEKEVRDLQMFWSGTISLMARVDT
jgi:hypothetical protein